ncbi:MAG: 1,4-dihydroxy-2-naphthoate octaprenyltransferase [Chloroflexota bacterium]|nr:1,4-dihydroxy-2-naphthoate octaprenyltransferase [Chloroflexota bacterium]
MGTVSTIAGWLKFWFGASRAPFFIAVITPAILGTAIGWQLSGTFQWHYFVLVLIGAAMINGGTNLVNDYYDHKSGNDEINVDYVAPFTGGSRMIQQGLLSPQRVFWGGMVCFALAAAIGAYLVWDTWASGPMVLILGAIGIFSGFFYTAPPLKLGYRWPAEAVVGLNCGVLVTLGAYWIQAQAFSWVPVIASIPLAILIAALLWVNEIPDYAADKAVGKNHIVVLIGKERAAQGYLVLLIAAYIVIVIGVVAGGVTPFALLGLLALPLAIRAMRVAVTNYADSKALAPANAMTPMIYLATGLLMSVGFVIEALV